MEDGNGWAWIIAVAAIWLGGRSINAALNTEGPLQTTLSRNLRLVDSLTKKLMKFFTP
jgi:hypothetical protein